MKALTHNLFSLGLGVYLLLRVERPPNLPDVLLVVWLVFATNWVIDFFGHAKRDGLSVRSFWTHSVFLAPVWGAATALASAYALDAITGQTMTAIGAVYLAALGTTLAFSHLFLDALTEGGIFFARRRRIALAHLRNGNAIANSLLSAAGVLLLLEAFA